MSVKQQIKTTAAIKLCIGVSTQAFKPTVFQDHGTDSQPADLQDCQPPCLAAKGRLNSLDSLLRVRFQCHSSATIAIGLPPCELRRCMCNSSHAGQHPIQHAVIVQACPTCRSLPQLLWPPTRSAATGRETSSQQGASTARTRHPLPGRDLPSPANQIASIV